MATYVNNLRLKEITTGDEDGTWGTSTNTNLELITDGFSYGTKQLAADANETFTMPDGTADDSRSFYLKITSAVSLTATREVTLGPNTVSKVWMIENATTGSQTITIKQGSGATVDVPTGEKVMVVTDGAGAGAAVLNANPSGATGGTVTSVSGTGTVNGISLSGTVTSSGNITLGGALTGVDLTSQVTGTLPTGNGGTGSTATTYCSLTANVTGILPTANGGTGLSSIGTANQVLAVNSGATALEYKTFQNNPSITATASGALADGDPVVIKSDGKVSAITSTSATTGSPQDTGEANATGGEAVAVSYDPSAGAMLISFRDDVSNEGRTMAATISGTTISYGTMTDVDVARDVQASVYYPTENATFLCELTNDDFEVVTVSGTTVTRIAGSQFDFTQNTRSACYDASADKLIGLGAIDVATIDYVSLQAVDLTGTTITRGSNTRSAGTLLAASGLANASITHDSVKNDNTFIVSNVDGTYVQTWSCSGTTLTNVFTSAFPGVSTTSREVRVIYGSTSNSYLFFYQDESNNAYPTVIGAVRVGDSFSYGSRVVVASGSYNDLQVGYNPAANKFLVSYRGASNYRYLHEVTPDGSDLGAGSAVDISNSVAIETDTFSNIAYDSDTEQNIIGYAITSDRSVFAVIYDPATSTLTSNTFIGFSDGAYSDTATATIQVVGSVDDAQTGLTTGKKHYVQTDGSLATSPDVPEVFAGTAISATQIITKG